MNKKHVSIYIHWPFCKSKCPYCDFNSHVVNQIDELQWLKAYLINIDYYKPYLRDKEVKSIFFGGGTPSLAPTGIIAEIIDTIARISTLAKDIEITLEANPTSVESQKFQSLSDAGVNRVSLGIQSFNASDLKFLGREHSEIEAKDAINLAAKYFKRYSLDFIYALPNQTLESWQQELEEIMQYISSHLSLYQLTIEKGTQFFKAYKQREFDMPSEELSAEFYELTQNILSKTLLKRYEISNHALPGHECIHNVNYWQYGDYIGIGPGAHGRYTQDGVKYATVQHYDPKIWLDASLNLALGNGNKISEPLSVADSNYEQILMGMRMQSGLPKVLFTKTQQKECNMKFLMQLGLLEEFDDNVKATDKGILVLNELIASLSRED